MDIEAIMRTLIFVVVLLVVVVGILFLLKEKGGDLLDSIARVLRFGR